MRHKHSITSQLVPKTAHATLANTDQSDGSTSWRVNMTKEEPTFVDQIASIILVAIVLSCFKGCPLTRFAEQLYTTTESIYKETESWNR